MVLPAFGETGAFGFCLVKRFNMKKRFVSFGLSFVLAGNLLAGEGALKVRFNASTGALEELNVEGDRYGMNALTATDGTQYPWVKQDYAWGLGYFTQTCGHESVKYAWKVPVRASVGGMDVCYREGGVSVRVERKAVGGDWVERYTLTNEERIPLALHDIGIYTPFNDNYPDARQCVRARVNAHIWDGGSAAYVNALRMGGEAPHLGLVVTEGAIKSYEVWERGLDKANSQTRGVFALNLPDMVLKPGEAYTLEWRLFSHQGKEDFRARMLRMGSVEVTCNRYVFEEGETARVELRSGKPLKACRAEMNGVPVAVRRENGCYAVEAKMKQAGEVRFDFYYDGGRQTHADCLVISDISDLVERRADFILRHQQMNDRKDLRDGAYMVYDNEGDSIYPNNTPNCNPVDRDEGAERQGMGVLLAKQYLLTGHPELKKSLLRYVRFIRQRLQTEDYTTYSSVDRKGRNRGYNYAWASDFYFLMYRVTGDRQYAVDGYRTLQALYRHFGHGFYCIGLPVLSGLQALKDAGMEKEHGQLLADFIRTGDVFIANGSDYPKHEVNYEQSIVAPAICFLAQLYLATKDSRYLDEVRRQMPVLEAFNGFQPSFHLNDVAIRHWDGYWFGKREMFGDTFPHYWSTLTGAAYYYYALCTGNEVYRRRARNVVRNNLCLFSEDGRASCAYLYPYKVDGIKGRFYDPYANDQDWALVYYLLVERGI